MSVTVDFENADEALDTYFAAAGLDDDNGAGDASGEDTPGESQWGEVTAIEELIGGWILWEQPHLEESGVSRYFCTRTTQNGQFQALNLSGVAENHPDDADLEALPHTEDEQEMRDAHQVWLDGADDDDIERGEPGHGDDPGGGDEGEQWSDWTEIDQASGWVIFRRQHLHEEDREEYLVAGESAAGDAVFLGPDGEVLDEEHIFEHIEDVQAALAAYAENLEQGNVPDEDRPTGGSPPAGALPGETPSRPPGSDLPLVGPAASAAGGLGNLLLIVAVLVVVGYYLESRGYIDLTDSYGPETDGVDNGGDLDE